MSGARDIVVIVGIALLPLCSIQHFIWPLSWCLLADICNHTWIPECGHDELMDAFRIFIDECDMFEYNCDKETDYEPVNYSECFKQQMCPVAKIPCPSRPTCPDHRYHRMGNRYIFLPPVRRNARRNGLRMEDLKGTLPSRMLKGKRRYTLKRTPTATKEVSFIRKIRTRIVSRTTLVSKPPTRTVTLVKPTRTLASNTKRNTKTKYTLPKSEYPDVMALTDTKEEPMSISSVTITSPETFQTVILQKDVVMRFGKKMIRVIKGRVK